MTGRNQCKSCLRKLHFNTGRLQLFRHLLILRHVLISEKLTCEKYVPIIANESVDNLLLYLLTCIKESLRRWFSFTKGITIP